MAAEHVRFENSYAPSFQGSLNVTNVSRRAWRPGLRSEQQTLVRVRMQTEPFQSFKVLIGHNLDLESRGLSETTGSHSRVVCAS